ncbi:hypothetical protein BKA70DRAFT_1561593, partial [Coprinopsis sp. MPI-PUGE-AT-0042]
MSQRSTLNQAASESYAVSTSRQTFAAAGHGPPSLRAATMLPGAHDIQIVDSTFSVVGGDIHNHHYQPERPRDIWAILRSIPNFRSVYQDMLSKATSGTGMWLVKGEKFGLWLEPNGDIK